MRSAPDNARSSMEPTQEPDNLAIERDTSNLIIGIANAFNSGKGYNDTMMDVLGMIAEILNPERLLVFERGSKTTSCTFEWHPDGVPSRIAYMQDIDNEQFDQMSRLAGEDDPVLTSSTADIKEIDAGIAQRFNRQGVSRMMAAPLVSDGATIGYLSANNYRLEKGIDAKRVLDTVAPFISTRIATQRLVDQLKRFGTHDELTGLLNRRGIDEAIERHLEENPDEPYVLALMDIDDFKIVNDLYGHDVGDEALRTLSRVITDTLPESALVGRNGGDEYLAMLFGKDLESIGTLLERFFNASFECELNGKKYPLSMSVGYAEYPTQAHDLQDAYMKADAALYSVKLAGKTGCRKYEPEHESQFRSQLGFTPRDIAENIPCGIVICKATDVGEILYVNDEIIGMLECENIADFMEFTGGTFEGIVHPDDRTPSKRELVRQAQDPAFRHKAYIDHRIITKTGAIKHVADNSRIVSFPKIGEVSYVLLVDLGEREWFKRLQSGPSTL